MIFLLQSVAFAVLLAVFTRPTASELCDSSKIFSQSVAAECPGKNNGVPRVDWQIFVAELYNARDLVFSNSAAIASDHLASLLGFVIADMATASECPFAVAATAHSFAETVAARGDVEQQGLLLLLLHTGLSFLPEGGARRSCSQWPLHGRELAGAFLGLVRKMFFSRVPVSAPYPVRVAVATTCPGGANRDITALIEANRQKYATENNYGMYFFHSPGDLLQAHRVGRSKSSNLTLPSELGTWRVHTLMHLLSPGMPYDWIMWLDCQVVITDMKRSVMDLLAAHGIGPTSDASLVVLADGGGLRPEALLLRNSASGTAFLDRWARRPAAQQLPPLRRQGSSFDSPLSWSRPPLGERAALRHAAGPYWATWLEAADPRRRLPQSDWGKFRWPSEVVPSLPASGPGGSGAFAAPATLSLAEEGLDPELARPWKEGDFAWYDACCGVECVSEAARGVVACVESSRTRLSTHGKL